ncbi:hypothetical protein PHYBOEH_001633 [Phytophthora boehmeriae]|uniref:PLAC8 family protein n=1 Tax=Phytophthora boehmeriae TaxID=109152 RepID=A0A8T1WTT3_9STRA|nr:hypothetical protein PHYBOEH_001633 [Phytophthora boehmeriae]
MADVRKPSIPVTPVYPTAYATPVQVVDVEYYGEVPPTPVAQTQRVGANEQGIIVGAWSADFWGCCDSMVPNCVMVTFCPCVPLAQISTRLGVARYKPTLAIFFVLILAQVSAILYPGSSSSPIYWFLTAPSGIDESTDNSSIRSWINTIVRATIFVYVWHLRQTTRRLFHIPGGTCGDCWASCCCSCCAMAQIATHIKSYKPGDCSFSSPDVLRAYQAGQT